MQNPQQDRVRLYFPFPPSDKDAEAQKPFLYHPNEREVFEPSKTDEQILFWRYFRRARKSKLKSKLNSQTQTGLNMDSNRELTET